MYNLISHLRLVLNEPFEYSRRMVCNWKGFGWSRRGTWQASRNSLVLCAAHTPWTPGHPRERTVSMGLKEQLLELQLIPTWSPPQSVSTSGWLLSLTNGAKIQLSSMLTHRSIINKSQWISMICNLWIHKISITNQNSSESDITLVSIRIVTAPPW